MGHRHGRAGLWHTPIAVITSTPLVSFAKNGCVESWPHCSSQAGVLAWRYEASPQLLIRHDSGRNGLEGWRRHSHTRMPPPQCARTCHSKHETKHGILRVPRAIIPSSPHTPARAPPGWQQLFFLPHRLHLGVSENPKGESSCWSRRPLFDISRHGGRSTSIVVVADATPHQSLSS